MFRASYLRVRVDLLSAQRRLLSEDGRPGSAPSPAMGRPVHRRGRGWIRGSMAAASGLACGVLAACGPETAPGAWSGQVRDSAGITIVTNPTAGAWPEGRAWSVERDLEIGGDPARPETLFGHIVDLAVGENGRIYALDAQAQIVRVFERDGGHAGDLGGPGEGPGELGQFTSSVLSLGDTVLVVDWGQSRITRFAPDGTPLSMETPPRMAAARTWWASARGALHYRSLARFTHPDGRWGGRDAILRYAGEGLADTVLVFDYLESDLGSPGAANVPLIVNAPSWTVLDDGRVAWMDLSRPHLRIHAPDGRLERIVTSGTWSPRAPTADDRATLMSSAGDRLEALGADRSMLAEMDVEVPALLPAITTVRAGPDGTIWVQRLGRVEDIHPMALNTPDPPEAFGGATWDVLDRDGRRLGAVELPPRFRLDALDDSFIHGVSWDALGVERILRLRLVRPADSSLESAAGEPAGPGLSGSR